MSLKENIEAVKKEIGTEEQFLEGIIKSERFFKKNKKSIIATAIVVVLAGSTYTTLNIVKESKLEASNKAYNILLTNPNDTQSETVLKNKNERLYNFYRFQKALKSNDIKLLKELAEYKKDPVISDLSAYQLAQLENKDDASSELLAGFVALQEGYKLLKEDKIEEAKLKFAQIDLNSPLKNVAKNLEHYQGIKYKGNN